MNPPHNSNQTPTTAQQVNPVINQQMGMLNPQQMCNGNVGGFMPNNRPNLNPPYMNGPNPSQPFPLQFPLGQFHNGIRGFSPQQNFNSFAVNQQQNNQLFPHNFMNVTPFYNPNVSLPNGHLPQPNMLQNVNQFMQLQNPNYAQYVPGNFPMFQSQIAQNRGPQNPNILVNQQFCVPNSYGPMQHVSQEQQRFVSPITDVNALKQSPMMNQQLQESSGIPHASGSIQRQETHNSYPTTSNFQEQGENEPTSVNAKWADSKRKNFNRHGKNDASQKGWKSRFQHTKGKFGIHNVNKNIGARGDAASNSVLANSTNQFHSQKKVLALNYTEQEIQQWREERKKHYPSKANMEQKLTENQTLPEVTDQAAKLRCQQLKEILAKQAELGCEVAEIPSSYLTDSEKRGKENERERNNKRKRGKSHKFDRKKKQRSENQNQDSSKANDKQNNKREPSLLQKLLTQDIKRDKSHILQVLRFIKLNSFFTEDPQKCLRFPSVIVKEIGSSEGKSVQVKSSLVSSKEKLEEEGEIVESFS